LNSGAWLRWKTIRVESGDHCGLLSNDCWNPVGCVIWRKPVPSGCTAQIVSSVGLSFTNGPRAISNAIHCLSGDQDGFETPTQDASSPGPGQGTISCGFWPSAPTVQIELVSGVSCS
jgi:hypothetical protein